MDKFDLQTELIYSDVQQCSHEKLNVLLVIHIAFSEEVLMDEFGETLWNQNKRYLQNVEVLWFTKRLAHRLKSITDSGQAFLKLDKRGSSVQRIFSEVCPNRKVMIHKDIAGLDRMI